jgi:hypothetical protein
MKKTTFLTACILLNAAVSACPVCERQQPEALKGIAHGAGPDSNWDYVTVGVITLITLFTLYYSIKWLVKPGEKDRDHIKLSILNNDPS